MLRTTKRNIDVTLECTALSVVIEAKIPVSFSGRHVCWKHIAIFSRKVLTMLSKSIYFTSSTNRTNLDLENFLVPWPSIDERIKI